MIKMIKKNISVYMLIETLNKLDKLIKGYIFPNRSVLVNYCVEFALPNIVKEFEKINKAIEINDLPNVLEFLKNRGFIIYTHSYPNKQTVPLGNIYFNSNNKKNKME